MPTYTTKKGRVLTAIIFTGDNVAEINAQLTFDTTEVVEGVLLVTASNGSQFYANINDYIVYNLGIFVEIMYPENF